MSDLGVTNLDDCTFLKAEDLDGILPPIQSRQLINAFCLGTLFLSVGRSVCLSPLSRVWPSLSLCHPPPRPFPLSQIETCMSNKHIHTLSHTLSHSLTYSHTLTHSLTQNWEESASQVIGPLDYSKNNFLLVSSSWSSSQWIQFHRASDGDTNSYDTHEWDTSYDTHDGNINYDTYREVSNPMAEVPS